MDLEDTLACLKLNDNLGSPPESQVPEFEQNNEEKTLRRSTRPKNFRNISYKEKRRVSTKPIKIKDEIDKINYYYDKRIKRLSPTLETIYEDSNEESEKSKPNMTLRSDFLCNKVKKHKMKVKKASAQQRLANRQKIPLKYLLEKLEEVRE